jgi:hypothetical protein
MWPAIRKRSLGTKVAGCLLRVAIATLPLLLVFVVIGRKIIGDIRKGAVTA